MKNLFGMNRNYFIHVNGDTLHDHFYHLKKQCRKKSQPLYTYRLDSDSDIRDIKF